MRCRSWWCGVPVADTKVFPWGHRHIEGLHDDAAALAYHLAHSAPAGHAAGDWRQFDRLDISALVDKHEDLHLQPLDAHAKLGEAEELWHAHLRVCHLTEPVHASLDLVRTQHELMHPAPGHVGGHDEPRFIRPGTLTVVTGRSNGKSQAYMDARLTYILEVARRGGTFRDLSQAVLDLHEKIVSGQYPVPSAWRADSRG